MPPSADNPAPLPVQFTVVVQFRTDTWLEAERLPGQIEHVAFRQAIELDSREVLVAFVTRVLQQRQGTSSGTGAW